MTQRDELREGRPWSAGLKQLELADGPAGTTGTAAARTEGPAAPPRPEVTIERAPSSSRRRTPLVPAAAIGAWLAAAASGVAALVLSALSLAELRAGLDTGLAGRLDLDPATFDAVVNGLLYATLGAIGLTAAVFALLAFALAGRRYWARILLVVVAVLNLPVVLAALGVVGQTAWIMLAAGAALTAVATIAMFLPGANAWLRERSGVRKE